MEFNEHVAQEMEEKEDEIPILSKIHVELYVMVIRQKL